MNGHVWFLFGWYGFSRQAWLMSTQLILSFPTVSSWKHGCVVHITGLLLSAHWQHLLSHLPSVSCCSPAPCMAKSWSLWCTIWVYFVLLAMKPGQERVFIHFCDSGKLTKSVISKNLNNSERGIFSYLHISSKDTTHTTFPRREHLF